MAALLNSITSIFSTPPRKQNAGIKNGLSVTAVDSGLQALHDELRRNSAQHPPSSIVREEIVLPWRNVAEHGAALAFTLDNVLSAEECRALIAATEATGYGQALINTGGGRQQLMEDVRNNTRCMIDDTVVAKIVFDRIAPFLPASYDSPNGHRSAPIPCALVGLNERLRFLKYTRGQKFAAHNDGMYMRPYTAENPVPERSFVTVQLYLNEGQGKDFEGGSTAFLNPSSRFRPDGELDPKDIVHCEPKAGRVLCFQHNLFHQGSEVTSGVKYCMRTDAMFQPPTEKKKQQQQDNSSSNSSNPVKADSKEKAQGDAKAMEH